MFNTEDLNQFHAKGIEMNVVEQQLEYFRNGFPFLRLERAATVGDGILKMTEDDYEKFEQTYALKLGKRKVFKFVPASGAATRMFKDLFDFLHADDNVVENNSVKEVLDNLDNFAFNEELKKIMNEKNIASSDRKKISAAILLNDGLNYGNLPKGMVLFHKYENEARTALEEHLVEGANYAKNTDDSVNLHFTVSPEHKKGFEELINRNLKKYENLLGIHYNIYFSQQKKSTDVIAVDFDNRPVRNSDGTILFRPGGHGALLENMNDIDADIIFIKNIDNVVPDKLKPVTVKYKKALAGLLIEIQELTFNFIQLLHDEKCNDDLINHALNFMKKWLSHQPPADVSTWTTEQLKSYILKIFNRPIRVCGMVRNEGEPGGGPFWVSNSDGSVSLQIVESSQIDANDPIQKAMTAEATHFNPVDLVCAVKDREEQRFDLLKYRNPDTGFISKKSKDGVELKAQELPGLWNGAMANWNTAFVEVPIETFNPVKTVNDLLRKQHQQ